MSVFALKILAMVSMVCDHVGYWLYAGELIGRAVYTAMRSFGRLAFPIFAFLIVNGWQHSRDKTGYLIRLSLFALVSQLPYVLVFTSPNYRAELGALSVQLPGLLNMTLCIALGFLWYRFVRRDMSALLIALLPFVGLCTVKLGTLYLLRPHMNVFYTLALSLGAMCVLDSFLTRRDWSFDACAKALVLVIALFLIRRKADYGLDGLLLLLMLWFFRDNRMQQLIMMLVWTAVHYLLGGGSFIYFICASMALLPVYFYNGTLGKPVKTVFYLVYPLHLSILGLSLIWQALV